MFKFPVFLLSLFCVSTLLAKAQDTKCSLIPREILFDNPKKTTPRISPDGTQLAYLAPDENNVLNIYVVNLEEFTQNKNAKLPEKKVTFETKRGIRSFLWHYDHEHILYLQDKDGDENWHLYRTNLKTQKVKDLTPYKDVQVGIVSYEPEFPDEVLIQMNKRDSSFFDIYRLNLNSGILELDTENPEGVYHWVADNNLCIRAASSFTDDGQVCINVRNSKNDPWRECLKIDSAEISNDVVSFSPDNKSFYLLSSLGGDTARLIEVHSTTGKQKVLVADPQYDISSFMINPKSHHLEAVGVEKERLEWVILDPKLKSDFTTISQVLKTPFVVVSRDLNNNKWLIGLYSDSEPYLTIYTLARLKKWIFFFLLSLP